MKLIGQHKSLLKFAAVLFATNVIGVATALACIKPPPPSGDDPGMLGCDDNSAVTYAYTITGADSLANSQIKTVSSLNGSLEWYAGGYGVINSRYWDGRNWVSSDGSHAIDNSGYTDFIALKFDTSVVLDKVTLGWSSVDADFSLLAWKGTTGSPTIADQSIASLMSSWALVGNYLNDAQGDTDIVVDVNSNKTSSSWWIISAYNARYSGNSGDMSTSTLYSGGYDQIKVLQVACEPKDTTKVSEPGSMMLLGAGLVGVMALRRRRQTGN